MFQQPPFTTPVSGVALTVPPTTVDGDTQVPVSLPQSWIPYIITALSALQHPALWAGTDADRLNAVEQATELIDRIGTATVEGTRPFFDEAADADNETNTSGQLWYEPVGDWIISGFLAVTVTPAAAIVYSVTIPKLRLALRAHDLGATFKILLNGLEIATGASYSPIEQLISIPLDIQKFAEAHALGSPPYTMSVEMVT